MDELSCKGCHELAAEMALGVLEGRARAGVLAHLGRCVGCQETVATMAVTADSLLDLLPERDPAPGFDARVVAVVNGESSTRRESVKSLSPRAAPVAALALVGALMTGAGWFLGDATDGAPPAIVSASQQRVRPAADMLVSPLLSGGREVGRTYIDPRNPSWLFVSVSDDGGSRSGPSSVAANSTVTCELVRLDGSVISLGNFPLRNGHAVWVTDTSVDPSSVQGTRLTTRGGGTLASGTFPRRGSELEVSGPRGTTAQQWKKDTSENLGGDKDNKDKSRHGKSHDKGEAGRGKPKPAHGDKKEAP